jgi:hypothetical protein
MHVRIACGGEDAALGRCSDTPARRRRRGRWTTQVACPAPPPADTTARR